MRRKQKALGRIPEDAEVRGDRRRDRAAKRIAALICLRKKHASGGEKERRCGGPRGAASQVGGGGPRGAASQVGGEAPHRSLASANAAARALRLAERLERRREREERRLTYEKKQAHEEAHEEDEAAEADAESDAVEQAEEGSFDFIGTVGEALSSTMDSLSATVTDFSDWLAGDSSDFERP